MKPTRILLFILFPALSSAAGLDSFFSDNPDLSGNIFVKEAIYEQAQAIAVERSWREETNEDLSNDVRKRLSSDGYEYALLGMRTLKSICKDSELMDVNNLTNKECVLIDNYKEK